MDVSIKHSISVIFLISVAKIRAKVWKKMHICNFLRWKLKGKNGKLKGEAIQHFRMDYIFAKTKSALFTKRKVQQNFKSSKLLSRKFAAFFNVWIALEHHSKGTQKKWIFIDFFVKKLVYIRFFLYLCSVFEKVFLHHHAIQYSWAVLVYPFLNTNQA